MDVFLLLVGSFLKVLFLNIRLLCCFYHGIGLNSVRHVSVLQLNKLSSVNRGSFSDCKGLRCCLKGQSTPYLLDMCRTQQITHITVQHFSSPCFLHSSLAEYKDKTVSFSEHTCSSWHFFAEHAPPCYMNAKAVLFFSWHFALHPFSVL